MGLGKKVISVGAVTVVSLGLILKEFNYSNTNAIGTEDNLSIWKQMVSKYSNKVQQLKASIEEYKTLVNNKDIRIKELEAQLSTLEENIVLISNMLGVNEGLTMENFDTNNLATYLQNIVNKISNNGEASEEQMNSLLAIANALGIEGAENMEVSELTQAIIREIGELQGKITELNNKIGELEADISGMKSYIESLQNIIASYEADMETLNNESEITTDIANQYKLDIGEDLPTSDLEHEGMVEDDDDKGGTEGAWQCAEHETVLVFATEEEFNNHIATEHKETNPTNAKEEAYNNLSANARVLADMGYSNGDLTYRSDIASYVCASATVEAKYTTLKGGIMEYNENVKTYLVNGITQTDVEALNNWANM